MKSDRAFAMLLPTDLLDCVALHHDDVVDYEVPLGMRAVRTVTLGGSGLWWIIHGADSQSGRCLCLKGPPRCRDGQHSDWTDSSAYECGTSFSKLDAYPDDSASDSDEEDDASTGGGLPTPAQAAMRVRAAPRCAVPRRGWISQRRHRCRHVW